MSEIITIAGRQFKGTKNSNLKNDVFVQGMIAEAELDRLEKLPGETADEFALRIFRKAAINSDVFLLLGGLLLPAELDPAKWTREVAEDTAAFFGSLTNPDDKNIVRGQILGAIMGFFSKGLIYSVGFPKYSGKDQPSMPNPTEGRTNLASGAASSGQSQVTT